jgi:hypothetical protein
MDNSPRRSPSPPLRSPDDQRSGDPGRHSSFPVTLTAGSLRDGSTSDGWTIPHVWTDDGVLVRAAPNGAGVLHVAVALCVLNDTLREGEALGISVHGVRVDARGEFDEGWASTGITYAVEVDSSAPDDDVARLLAHVDEVAEIPRTLRAGMSVGRVDG